ncbi:fructose-specific PTS transporter subunit EIIC [Moraxella macacae]|nr:fructose-specific PTS transporter subunit EIIC [Moraxella macacae]
MKNLVIIHAKDDIEGLILAKKLAFDAKTYGVYSDVLNDEFGDGIDNAMLEAADKIVVIGRAKFEAFGEYLQKLTLIEPIDIAGVHAFDVVKNAPVGAIESAKVDFGKTDLKPLSFVAITACPTGVAHTFMAAEALENVGKELGYAVKVETQGSVGAKNILTADEIANADFVILAADIEVNADRFVGKKVYRTSTGQALKHSKQTFANTIQNAKVYDNGQKNVTAVKSGTKSSEKIGIYKHLMTGVSFMLPIVVAGGLLIAMSFVFGINAFEAKGSLADVLMQTGKAAFSLMIPILAGYIAYSIADRAGLTAGLVGGWLSSQLGAGFLGAIVAGFLAGYIANFLVKKVHLPQTMEALKPILIIPLLSSLVIGLLMFYVVGTPVAYVLKSMEVFLTGLGTGNLVLLGAILGGMMCVDMGGPINKAAYTFSVGLLTLDNPNQFPIAAAMAGGMVPAIGMGIATLLAKNKFSTDEQNAGKASLVLGLCFISEGAIPFAAKDPSRVLPSCIIGGALTGGLVGLMNMTLAAPHGGVFVLLIPNAINQPLMYLVAIAVGSVVTGGLYALLKPKLISPIDSKNMAIV